jgi:hypothetical protein
VRGGLGRDCVGSAWDVGFYSACVCENPRTVEPSKQTPSRPMKTSSRPVVERWKGGGVRLWRGTGGME